jgi:hypothetical protein
VDAALALGHTMADLERERRELEDVMDLEGAAELLLAYHEADLQIAAQDHYEWDDRDDEDGDDYECAVL